MLFRSIPHLDLRHKKAASVFVKMLELKSVLEYYGQEEEKSGVQSGFTAEIWKKETINAMRPFLSDDKQLMMDLILKFIEIKKILEKLAAAKVNKDRPSPETLTEGER